MSNAGSVVCWSVLCCEIILLLNMADMGHLLLKTGVSKAEYLVHSIHMNRLVHQWPQPIQQDLVMLSQPFPLRIETHTVPWVSDFHSALLVVIQMGECNWLSKTLKFFR